MLQFTRCLHTAILVSDLEKAEYFYGQILGLTKIDRTLNYLGAWYQIGEYQIHLIVAPNYIPLRDNDEKWGRNPHIAIEVTNLEDAIALLESQGYSLQKSASGRQAIFVPDPDGNILEITSKVRQDA